MLNPFRRTEGRNRKGRKTVFGVEAMEKREVLTGTAAGAVFGTQTGPGMTYNFQQLSDVASGLTTEIQTFQSDLEFFAAVDVKNAGVSPYFTSAQLANELALTQKAVTDAENLQTVVQNALGHSQKSGYTVAQGTLDVSHVDYALNQFETVWGAINKNPVMATYITYSYNHLDQWQNTGEIMGLQNAADGVGSQISNAGAIDTRLHYCLTHPSE